MCKTQLQKSVPFHRRGRWVFHSHPLRERSSMTHFLQNELSIRRRMSKCINVGRDKNIPCTMSVADIPKLIFFAAA